MHKSRNQRRLNVERLEPRMLLTAGSDPFRELLSHGGLCGCPICTGQDLEAIEPAAIATAPSAPSFAGTPTGLPLLSSRPGAPATLYLDFNGHAESSWGGWTNVATPAYDVDGDYSTFSAAESAAIREIWARVAEDYAPFNINVTTVAPPMVADRAAVRLAIGGHYSDWFGSSAGGVAYVGGFYGSAPNIGYVFEDALGNGNPRYTAEAASHEAGHLFGLAHQAVWSGAQLAEEYNTGSGDWAPIMGVGYYAGRTTWHRGTTDQGPAAHQDDLATLAGASNGFGYIADDYGSTTATAAALPVVGGSVSLSGLIGRTDDRDLFRFTTGGGSLSFTLDVAPYGPNLDAVFELLNSAGQTLLSMSPGSSLGASLATTVAAGTYYLAIHASGGYGNLGQYTLRGTVLAQTPQPPPTPQQPGTPSSAAIRIIDNGAAGFTAAGIWRRATGLGRESDVHWAYAGNGQTAATWTFAGLEPGQYRVAATWPGSRLYATNAPFSFYSDGQFLGMVRVNQQRASSTFSNAGSQWQNLGIFSVSGNSLTVRLPNHADGRVVADGIRLERVYSTSGGTPGNRSAPALDQNLAGEPTLYGVASPLLPLGHLQGGSSNRTAINVVMGPAPRRNPSYNVFRHLPFIPAFAQAQPAARGIELTAIDEWFVEFDRDRLHALEPQTRDV
jgi:hypothetical protein